MAGVKEGLDLCGTPGLTQSSMVSVGTSPLLCLSLEMWFARRESQWFNRKTDLYQNEHFSFTPSIRPMGLAWGVNRPDKAIDPNQLLHAHAFSPLPSERTELLVVSRDAPEVSPCWLCTSLPDSWLSQLAASVMLRLFLVGKKLTFLGFSGYSTAEIAQISTYNMFRSFSEINQGLRVL